MPLNSPLSDAKLDRLIKTVALTPDASAIDFGCGDGEFLIRLNLASKASCLGVDQDKTLITNAKAKLENLPGVRVEFRQLDVAALPADLGPFDLAVCMGASHAFAEGEPAYGSALQYMQKVLKPKGMILIGEGYWKREPDPEYLQFLGDPVGIYNSYEENIAQAARAGLVPVYATQSNLDEWDHFEWSFLLNAEREALAKPEDVSAQQKLGRIRKWNAFYRRYGRSTMGYAHYIFMAE